MVIAAGSYPAGRWFESDRRYQIAFYGLMVKRLRHRPFTAVTGVQFSLRSPKKLFACKQYGSIAQLGERLPYKQDVIGSSPIVPTTKTRR